MILGSQTCVCERQRKVFMKANMGRAVYRLLVYTRYIKVPNMVVISQYIMFTIALWFHATSGVTPLQHHTKVFQIVGHEPEWITYDRHWDVFEK